MNWKNALTVSLFIALMFSAIQALTTSALSFNYAPADWAAVDKMSYAEGQRYLAERTTEISPFQSIQNAVQYSHFWYSALITTVVYFLGVLLACWLYQFSSKPNNSVQQTTGS